MDDDFDEDAYVEEEEEEDENEEVDEQLKAELEASLKATQVSHVVFQGLGFSSTVCTFAYANVPFTLVPSTTGCS